MCPSDQEALLDGAGQLELLGAPSSRTYEGYWLRMPDWYTRMCEELSRALHAGELTDDEADAELEHWHPLALDQLGRREPRAWIKWSKSRERLIWPRRRHLGEDAILADLAALTVSGHVHELDADEVA